MLGSGATCSGRHQNPKSDIEIARNATLHNIDESADKLALPSHGLLPCGQVKAGVDPDYAESLTDKPEGELGLVAGITPTPPPKGEDHDRRRARRRPGSHPPVCGDPPARALARRLLRRQGLHRRRSPFRPPGDTRNIKWGTWSLTARRSQGMPLPG